MSRCTRYGNGAACVYSGSCTCGAITYTIKNGNASRQPPIRKVDICHCSQCKEESKTYKDERLLENPGAPWMAVPRAELQFIFGSSLQKEHFSNFAERGSCQDCGDPLYIQYDCEKHTTMVHMETLKSPPMESIASQIVFNHIHCKSELEEDSKGNAIYSESQSWEPDPCRPQGVPVPELCYECFQLLDSCKCA